MRTSLIMARRLAFGVAVLGGINLDVAGQCDYEVTAIIEGPVCGGETDPTSFLAGAMADNGDVAGAFSCFILLQGATWDGINGTVPLPFLSGFNDATVSGLTSINEVVGSQFSSTLDWRAVIWHSGVPTRLPDWPGSNTSRTNAINRNGWITGQWGNTVLGPGIAAIIWKPDRSMLNISADVTGTTSQGVDINDFGQVTGWFGSVFSPQAYMWDNGQVIELPIIPGGLTSQGVAINNHGHIVGLGRITPLGATPSIAHAFFWDGLTMIDIGTLLGLENSAALDINDIGQIVGVSSVPSNHAFLWRDGVMIDLNTFLPPEFDGFSIRALAITRNGEILLSAVELGVGIILSPVGSGPGDIDNNCTVNVGDLLLLLSEWGESISVADINLDGDVNVTDLLLLLASWG